MSNYFRLYSRGSHGQLCAVDEFDADGDFAAIAHATKIAVNAQCWELWNGARLVLLKRIDVAPAPRDATLKISSFARWWKWSRPCKTAVRRPGRG